MPLTDLTVTLEEVAAALGRSPAWLRRHHRALTDRRGFPRRLGEGWVWPRRLVEVWINAGGMASAPLRPANDDAPAAAEEADVSALVDAQRASLSLKYGGQ